MSNIIKLSLFTLGSLASSFTLANDISPDFLKKEIELAQAQYVKGSPESGLYALEALARILESDNSNTLQSEIGPNNLAYTYLRIGLLQEKSGNQSEAKAYFNKSLSSYKGKAIEIAQLKEAVSSLDAKRS